MQQSTDWLDTAAATPGDLASLKSILAALVDGVELADDGAPPLEMLAGMDEAPQLVGCQILEGPRLEAHQVGTPISSFRAFLDGRQKSEAIAFVRGIPLILGTVAAVIRIQETARATTWGVARDSKLYAPLAQVGGALPVALHRRIEIVDTDAETVSGSASSRHPLELNRRAFHLIQNARERMEHSLVVRWCEERSGEALLIDGSISRISSGSDLGSIVGLVKSHRTMYLRDDEVERVLSLRAGERSSSFLIESRNGPVASWYLRLRRESGYDPLWGLVRVEIPVSTHSRQRVDEVSRWVMAETSPISLPDPRWDRLIYGVRDCEMFLSAVM